VTAKLNFAPFSSRRFLPLVEIVELPEADPLAEPEI
jgi:hypothetical protein